MAATDVKNDSVVISADERKLVVSALELKLKSVDRALKAESNPVVRDARAVESSGILALIGRFR